MARHFSDCMEKLYGKPRESHTEITQRDMDLSFAMQRRFEEVFFHLLKELYKRVPYQTWSWPEACALNSVANGKLFTETPFRRTWIQPRPVTKGWLSGAALHTYHSILKQPRRYVMKIPTWDRVFRIADRIGISRRPI